MTLLERIFPKSTAITSAAIRAEIDKAQDQITVTRTELSTALGEIAVMSDAEHQKADERAATLRRAVARLEAKIAGLESELPVVVAAEEATATAAANDALRARAEAARKSNTKEAAALLREYDSLAGKIGDVFYRLNEIVAETDSVNKALRLNPVAECVLNYNTIHRKAPDREASEQRDMRPVWRYASGDVVPAIEDGSGGYKNAEPRWLHHEQRLDVPVLTHEEIVVSRTSFRAGAYLHDLSDVRLPPGTVASEKWHWPRKS